MPKKTILIIEDVKTQRDIYSYNIKKAGYEVLIAKTGEEGLETAKAQKPDLILLDIMLPGINGFDVCKQLKKLPETKDIPIFISSAKSQEKDLTEGIEAGAIHYMVKPLDIQQLLNRTIEIIGKPE
ncbi:hypothetical protein BVX93_00125 [bacterium B13(2017)]|nr:hypothetical protein BVX93_00125 [bacterium B13(2017)]